MNKNLLETITLLGLIGMLASILKVAEETVYLLFIFTTISFLLCSEGRIGKAIRELKFSFKKKNNPGKIDWTINAKELGKRIKIERKKKNLTQDDLAKQTKIARPNICRIECGKHSPSLPTLERIAKALGIEVNELVK